MNPPDFPTPWQRKTMWGALAALAVVAIGAIGVGLVWVASKVLGFLQPILIPFAVAGVLAYLLDPVVSRVVAWGTSRQRAVLAVFLILSLTLAGVLVWIVPAISHQTANLARKVPGYSQRVKTMVVNFSEELREKYGISLLPLRSPGENGELSPEASAAPTVTAPTPPAPAPAPLETPGATASPDAAEIPEKELATTKPAGEPELADPNRDLQELLSGAWMQRTAPTVIRHVWTFIKSSVGGFLGAFGFLLSMIIVPVYLYYFLIESRNIAAGWGDYVPLRASAFKDEVVSTLEEINGYLIAFFRGQLVVSLINGTATGIGLVVVGLDFGLLIGLALCILGIIPYIGIILCWVPAVIIASVQDHSWLVPADSPWWVFPLVVTAIFTVVQQIDGLFITPKIVGESVGLHPMTVIASVFVWSLLMGGLLGAILAVPMTATLKVLLKRYVWERRLAAEGNIAAQAVEIAALPDRLPAP